ncbi:MAG: hypothetical protein WC494_03335 [Candidatus Pacearchaeota archaeon]
MKKVIGYVLCIIGLLILVFSAGIIKVNIKILNTANPYYVIGTGIVFIIIGAVLVMTDKDKNKKKSQQSEEEVPIYEGTGKKRRIVGYRRS